LNDEADVLDLVANRNTEMTASTSDVDDDGVPLELVPGKA
jgi:hypothetical protein